MEPLADTLRLIAAHGCSRTTGRARCPEHPGLSRVSFTGTADQWCDECRAYDALVRAGATLPCSEPMDLDEWGSPRQWCALPEGHTEEHDPAPPTRCCDVHQPGGCCDPDDCGPCCPDCPTCPTLARMRQTAYAPPTALADTAREVVAGMQIGVEDAVVRGAAVSADDSAAPDDLLARLQASIDDAREGRAR